MLIVWAVGLILLAMVAIACASLKRAHDFRTARDTFYEEITYNRLSEVKELLGRFPSLIRTDSPVLRVPGPSSIYTIGVTPLSVAIMHDSRETFDYLLSESADVNARGKAQLPPIIQAVVPDDTYYFKTLLDHGADPSVRDRYGKTALDYAKKWGKEEILDLISKHRPKEPPA
jgi:hypothetical protein